MAVESIGNLVQSLADQVPGQTNETQVGANAPGTGNIGDTVATEDTFTLSTQSTSAQDTAQDAGIFQVSQGALTAVTANILFAQRIANTNPNGAQGADPSAPTTNAGDAQPGAAANSNAAANPGQLFAAIPAAQAAATAAAATSANVQQQLQALNAALPALKLSKEEIQEIDRIASQIQNFNPAAYTSLVSQFETQAQLPAEQSAANAAASIKANGGGSQT
jgi:hypothetical protein